jgi:hypothetical protein
MACKKKRHKKCHFFNSKGDKNAVQNCVVVIFSGSVTGAEIDPNGIYSRPKTNACAIITGHCAKEMFM